MVCTEGGDDGEEVGVRWLRVCEVQPAQVELVVVARLLVR
jgi:hypothetical protein